MRNVIAVLAIVAVLGTVVWIGPGLRRDPHARSRAELVEIFHDITNRSATLYKPGDANDRAWVKRTLHDMAAVDQAVRSTWTWPEDEGVDEQEAEYFHAQHMVYVAHVDARNLSMLRPLVAAHGWFTIRDWGEETERDAWLLVQHADKDPAFQREVLGKLEPLVATHDVAPRSYAYLYDRVARAEDRPQRYGTQGDCLGVKDWKEYRVEDPPQLDARRASVGLEPIADHRKVVGLQCR